MAVSELVGMRTNFTSRVARLIEEGERQGFLVALNECKRSPAQSIINALGRTGKLVVATALRGVGYWELAAAVTASGRGIRNSLHEQGLAVDLLLYDVTGRYLTTTESYRELGEWWERQHGLARWGGRFGDAGHFSFTYQGRR